jgi:SagB-type dehydrogenase family enzyme
MNDPTIRAEVPLTFLFHRNTTRWAHSADAAGPDVLPLPQREHPDLPAIALPAARLPDASFAALVAARFSCRRFAPRALDLQALADLLFSGYGVLSAHVYGKWEFPHRPVPSGGGLYPLELTVVARNVANLEPGIYHYHAVTHTLEQMREVALPKAFAGYLFMGQGELAGAPVVIMISAHLHRSLRKYGDRGYRYVLFEAGHVAQNLNLTATALGLGSCNIGGFFDVELGDLLRLDREREVALYGIAVGHPDGTNPIALRGLDQI